MLERKDCNGRSVLGMAALGGSVELFQQALKVIEELYTDGQVRVMYIMSAIKSFNIFLESFWGDSKAFKQYIGEMDSRFFPPEFGDLLSNGSSAISVFFGKFIYHRGFCTEAGGIAEI